MPHSPMVQKTKGHRFKHGHALKPISKEYSIWVGIRSRTTNPQCASYRNYGGRGITLDARWQSFEQFFADMGPAPSPKHSIDRRDNNGPYSPENCRWASAKEQQRNRRDHVRYVHPDGRALLLCEWEEQTGIPVKTLHDRIVVGGWSVERAVSVPIRRGRPALCQRGHELAVHGRWEGRSRRCRLCKLAYDKARREGCFHRTRG